MGHATKDAEDISKGLLEATQKQAREIETAGEAGQLITKSIKEVDSSAARSAEVARRTLAVTEQGAQAVRNTISGMDGIREQIQDTSKRIKTPWRKLAGDRRNRGSDFRYYRTDQCAGVECGDPGGFRR